VSLCLPMPPRVPLFPATKKKSEQQKTPHPSTPHIQRDCTIDWRRKQRERQTQRECSWKGSRREGLRACRLAALGNGFALLPQKP
jgi:hypothetical protein